MAAAEEVQWPFLSPRQAPAPPTTPSGHSKLRGKSVSSRANIVRDGELPEAPVPTRQRSKSVAGLRNRAASTSQSGPPPLPADLPPIPNFVLSAKARSDCSPSQPPSPSVRPFTAEPASGQTQTKVDKEIDDLAAQLDLEIEEAERRKEAERKRKEAEEAARYADEVARLEAETDRILAEQRKLDLARLQVQLSTSPQPKPKRVILDKLTLFGRSRKPNPPAPATPAQPPGTPSTIAPTIFTPSLSRASSIDGSSPPPDRMSFIEPKTPMTDAPVSAVNGGARRITVRCLSSTISVEVDIYTSPIDILQAAADMTRHDVDIDTFVVVECYVALGLERRLRRYESVRDILNTWDRDHENSLLIMSADPSDNNDDLDVAPVPLTEEPPSGFTVQLYHSARPGKWNKRFVTLLNSGQMFTCKRADSQVSDKDSISLCHLSDFDIYKPQDSELRRNLKPPKKFCYGVKSQQRTVLFPNGENYVHFFCTDDNELAERFRQMVHAWRSWYLVNKRGRVRIREKPPQLNFSLPEPEKSSSTSFSSSLQVPNTALSISSGSFMDESDFAKAIEESAKKLAEEAQQAKAAASRRKPSVASVAPALKNELEFSPGGLLGDAYEKRKEAEAAKAADEAKDVKAEGPFTEGPSLLNSIGTAKPDVSEPTPQATSWFPSATEHTARLRSHSIDLRRPVTSGGGAPSGRDKRPPPLLNFAGNFPEPPRAPLSARLPPKESMLSPMAPRFPLGPGPDGPRGPPRHPPGPRPGSRGGQGLRPPPGSPLINYATGGPSGGRPGPPPGNGPPPPPPGARGRSRSTVGAHLDPRFPPAEDLPPLPMSPMSPRAPGPRPRIPPPDALPRGRDPRSQDRPHDRPHERPPHDRHQQRPQSPLVNRAQ